MNEHETYDDGPVAALRRIAFLLERGLQDSYRVKAYRTAAAAISTMDVDSLRVAAARGTLAKLDGVGPSTAEVITEALDGRRPARLVAAEKDFGGPLTDAGGELRKLLRGDLHSHSDWSDGGSPIEEMAETARDLGHEYLVLTDHSPRLKIARGLSPERLQRQLGVVAEVNEQLDGDHDFTLLTGIEVDILDDGSLDQKPDLLARLDVRVASVHSKLAMETAAMTRRMVAAVSKTQMNVLGHCTGRLIMGGRGPRAESKFDARAVFAACVEHDVAVEINSRPERRDPPSRLIEMARDMGCLFSIDTDAHAPGQLDFLAFGCERAAAAGIDPDRIVNTWPKERLLTWASSRS